MITLKHVPKARHHKFRPQIPLAAKSADWRTDSAVSAEPSPDPMKRFFAPVGGPSAKRARADGAARPEEARCASPLRFGSWNANSLKARARSSGDADALEAFVASFRPDVLAVQETWLRREGAAGSTALARKDKVRRWTPAFDVLARAWYTF